MSEPLEPIPEQPLCPTCGQKHFTDEEWREDMLADIERQKRSKAGQVSRFCNKCGREFFTKNRGAARCPDCVAEYLETGRYN